MNDRSKLNIEECWYDKRLPAVYMSKQRQWPKILSQPNGQILLSYVNNNIKSTDLNAIDLGCGACSLAQAIQFKSYTGYDLDHMIENVAKPAAKEFEMKTQKIDFIKGDFYRDDMSFLSNYDIIASSGFLDVSHDPLYCFSTMLEYASRYVLVHRQMITEHPTDFFPEASYFGSNTSLTCNINKNDLDNVLKKFDMKILHFETLPDCQDIPRNLSRSTFLLEKNK